MTKTKSISIDDLRRVLADLGFKEKQAPKALIFQRAKDELLILRLYQPGEDVAMHDLASARKFLDWWGLLDATDFDALVHAPKKPA